MNGPQSSAESTQGKKMIRGAIHPAMAFGVNSVSEVDGCGELDSVKWMLSV
jgi:hypothetical protein